MSDKQVIRDTVIGVAHYVDHRQWVPLRQLFGTQVHSDYTSLFGGEPLTQTGDDLIAGWKRRLEPVQATQHLLGSVVTEVTGGTATACCHVRGYHFHEGLPGGNLWMVAGHYVFRLIAQTASWKIDSTSLEVFYQEGNRNFFAEVAAQLGK